MQTATCIPQTLPLIHQPEYLVTKQNVDVRLVETTRGCIVASSATCLHSLQYYAMPNKSYREHVKWVPQNNFKGQFQLKFTTFDRTYSCLHHVLLLIGRIEIVAKVLFGTVHDLLLVSIKRLKRSHVFSSWRSFGLHLTRFWIDVRVEQSRQCLVLFS